MPSGSGRWVIFFSRFLDSFFGICDLVVILELGWSSSFRIPASSWGRIFCVGFGFGFGFVAGLLDVWTDDLLDQQLRVRWLVLDLRRVWVVCFCFNFTYISLIAHSYVL